MSKTVEISDDSARQLREIATTTQISEPELIERALRAFFCREDNADILAGWEQLRQYEAEFGPLPERVPAPAVDPAKIVTRVVTSLDPKLIRRYGEEC